MKYYTVEGNNKSIFKIFAIYYICMAIFCAIRILTSAGYVLDGVWGDVYLSTIVQIGIMFLIPLFLYCVFFRVKPKSVFKSCNFDKLGITAILISIVLGIICFFINIAVSSLFSGILTFTGYRYPTSSSSNDYSTWHFFVEIFLVAVLPGFCEEFVHRGIVLQGTKHAGFKKAIVISSLMFGLIHFNVQQFFYAFIIGIILGFVSVVAKNIFPAMIIHFVNNAISVYLDYASNRNWLFGDTLDKVQGLLSSGNTFAIFAISAGVMILIVLLLCLFIWLLYKQSMVRKVNKAIDNVYNSPIMKDNVPIVVNKQEIIMDLLEKNTLLNLDYKKMDNPIDMVLPKEKSRYMPNYKDKIFMWGAITLGGLVTLFTYIWGLL